MDLEEIAKWVIAAIATVAVAWAPVSCTKHSNDKIESAIKSGIDPILARCAYSSGGGTSASAECSVAASMSRSK